MDINNSRNPKYPLLYINKSKPIQLPKQEIKSSKIRHTLTGADRQLKSLQQKLHNDMHMHRLPKKLPSMQTHLLYRHPNCQRLATGGRHVRKHLTEQ